MANAKKTEGKTSNMKSKATEAYKAVNAQMLQTGSKQQLITMNPEGYETE